MGKCVLQIITKSTNRDTKLELYFAVVDLDKATEYPENFVCILPKLTPNNKDKNAFRSTFGDQSVPLAKNLLTKALRTEHEPAIKAEIEQRLKALKPKPNTRRQARASVHRFGRNALASPQRLESLDKSDELWGKQYAFDWQKQM